METVGKNTLTKILSTESHKLHCTFTADAAIKTTQPVKLTAVGRVTPWAKADGEHAMIGHAVYAPAEGAVQGDQVTIAMRGFQILHGVSNSACDCGPATYEGMQTTGDYTGLTKWDDQAAQAVTLVTAWIMDQASDQGQLIRVCVRD